MHEGQVPGQQVSTGPCNEPQWWGPGSWGLDQRLCAVCPAVKRLFFVCPDMPGNLRKDMGLFQKRRPALESTSIEISASCHINPFPSQDLQTKPSVSIAHTHDLGT